MLLRLRKSISKNSIGKSTNFLWYDNICYFCCGYTGGFYYAKPSSSYCADVILLSELCDSQFLRTSVAVAAIAIYTFF